MVQRGAVLFNYWVLVWGHQQFRRTPIRHYKDENASTEGLYWTLARLHFNYQTGLPEGRSSWFLSRSGSTFGGWSHLQIFADVWVRNHVLKMRAQ